MKTLQAGDRIIIKRETSYYGFYSFNAFKVGVIESFGPGVGEVYIKLDEGGFDIGLQKGVELFELEPECPDFEVLDE